MAKNSKKRDDVNVYELYMKDITKYGTIDDAKTREYIRIYKNGTQNERKIAKERIVGAHQRYVHSVANKFINKGNIMDLISEGNIGLLKAIEEYNVESEVKFTTYAMYWIRKYIMAYNTLSVPIVTPCNAIKLATYVPKAKKLFFDEHQRQPSLDELQELLKEKYNLNFSNKEDLLSFTPMSLDEKYGEDEDGQEFMENDVYTSKTATCNIDDDIKERDTKFVANNILSHLSERDSYILKCIYGFDGEPKSINEVALEIGMSYERVRQIAVNSIAKLGEKYKSIADIY